MKIILKFTAILAISTIFIGCEEENIIAEVEKPSGTTVQASAASQPAASSETTQATANTSAAEAGAEDSTTPDIPERAGALTPPADRPTLEKGVDPVQQILMEDVALMFLVSTDWKFQEPSNQMRLFEAIVAENPDTDENVLMTVFYFGPAGGGTAANNISRWVGQVETTQEPTIYQYEQNDLIISEVFAKGTLVPSGMGTGPTSPVPNSFLYGVIVEEGPLGSVYFKFTGPQSLLNELQPSLHTMIDTIQIIPEELRTPPE